MTLLDMFKRQLFGYHSNSPPAPTDKGSHQHCRTDPQTGAQVCVFEQSGSKNETKIHDEGGKFFF